MSSKRNLLWACIAGLMFLGGCATKAPPRDYSAWMKAKPATLLVMPPVNDSPDVKATPSVWSHATRPLSEAGYYVLPVTLVDETFRQNGVHTASDAHDIPYPKLREVFGADAAVYIRVKRYAVRRKRTRPRPTSDGALRIGRPTVLPRRAAPSPCRSSPTRTPAPRARNARRPRSWRRWGAAGRASG